MKIKIEYIDSEHKITFNLEDLTDILTVEQINKIKQIAYEAVNKS